MKKPCVGCGKQVPEQGEYPYPDCDYACPLASEWRKEHVDHAEAIADARVAGYREGVEAAAKLFTRRADSAWSVGEVKDMEEISAAIRALAHAKKKEQP